MYSTHTGRYWSEHVPQGPGVWDGTIQRDDRNWKLADSCRRCSWVPWHSRDICVHGYMRTHLQLTLVPLGSSRTKMYLCVCHVCLFVGVFLQDKLQNGLPERCEDYVQAALPVLPRLLWEWRLVCSWVIQFILFGLSLGRLVFLQVSSLYGYHYCRKC